jgi:alkylation response protein AidB-like acyl-CoA dehydrogenase
VKRLVFGRRWSNFATRRAVLHRANHAPGAALARAAARRSAAFEAAGNMGYLWMWIDERFGGLGLQYLRSSKY